MLIDGVYTMNDRWITDWEPSERFPVYTRANAGEILPDPVSPLGWDLIWEEGVSKVGLTGRIDKVCYAR